MTVTIKRLREKSMKERKRSRKSIHLLFAKLRRKRSRELRPLNILFVLAEVEYMDAAIKIYSLIAFARDVRSE